MGWTSCFHILIDQMPKRLCRFQSHDSIEYSQHANATPHSSSILILSPSQNPTVPQGRLFGCKLSMDTVLCPVGGGDWLYLADPGI